MKKIPVPNGAKFVEYEILENMLIVKFDNEYKNGDYVVLDSDCLGIYAGNNKLHCYIDNNYIVPISTRIYGFKIKRLASKSQIAILNEALLKRGYKFNNSKLELQKLPKRAKKGELFYYLSATLNIVSKIDNRDNLSNPLYESGNYALSASELKVKQKQVINIFN